jgi:cytochrome P450
LNLFLLFKKSSGYWKHVCFWTSQGVPVVSLFLVLHALPQYAWRPIFEIDYEHFLHYGRVYVDYYLGGCPTLNISDPELVHQVFFKLFNNCFHERERFPWPNYVREGIAFQNGKQWKRLHAVMASIFNERLAQRLYPQIRKTTEQTI